jgi:hypothetical protein
LLRCRISGAQPLIVGLFVLTLLIVLWAPRFIKASLRR